MKYAVLVTVLCLVACSAAPPDTEEVAQAVHAATVTLNPGAQFSSHPSGWYGARCNPGCTFTQTGNWSQYVNDYAAGQNVDMQSSVLAQSGGAALESWYMWSVPTCSSIVSIQDIVITARAQAYSLPVDLTIVVEQPDGGTTSYLLGGTIAANTVAEKTITLSHSPLTNLAWDKHTDLGCDASGPIIMGFAVNPNGAAPYLAFGSMKAVMHYTAP